jgi:predicted TIM-barrel fold metal-dependent hydrolase
MKIDGRVHIGEALFGQRLTVADLLARMDRLHIDRAIVAPFRPRQYHLGPSNDYVAKAVAENPGRLLGVCRVDPWQGEDAVAELKRSVERLGLRGVYLNPWEENYQINNEIVHPVIREAGRLGVPVMINAGQVRVSHPSQVADLAQTFPDITFIASNGGNLNISGGLLAEARTMLESCPNVFIETSGTYREDFLEEVMTEVGNTRVLFASGAPHYDQEFEMERVICAHVDDADKQAMWSGNLLRIFNWS